MPFDVRSNLDNLVLTVREGQNTDDQEEGEDQDEAHPQVGVFVCLIPNITKRQGLLTQTKTSIMTFQSQWDENSSKTDALIGQVGLKPKFYSHLCPHIACCTVLSFNHTYERPVRGLKWYYNSLISAGWPTPDTPPPPFHLVIEDKPLLMRAADKGYVPNGTPFHIVKYFWPGRYME